ncbi:MAG: DUF2202 domain-containing protein [Bryobacterales bacterium]|nr:DUF2202 domain-containing protein [Bryobacterales bacterium]
MNRNSSFFHAAGCFLLAFSLTSTLAAQPFGNGPSAGPGFRIDAAPLTATEAASVSFMREEERLARDLYLKLAEKWNLNVFRNIAASEQQHFDAMGKILANKNLPDPSAGKEAGVYAEPTLNTLFNELYAKGMKSIEDALAVGVAVETTDIADLEKAIAATTRTDLKRAYTNLMNASYSHLEAFENNIEVLCPLAPAN